MLPTAEDFYQLRADLTTVRVYCSEDLHEAGRACAEALDHWVAMTSKKDLPPTIEVVAQRSKALTQRVREELGIEDPDTDKSLADVMAEGPPALTE